MKILLILCCLIFQSSFNTQISKNKIAVQLNDKEIKEQGYRIKKKDTLFMNNGILDIIKIKKEGSPVESSVPTDKGWKSTISYNYEKTLDNGTYVYITGNILSGFRKKIRKKESSFESYFEYYPSGNLKLIGRLYINEFTDGIWYQFDKKGDIEKYINHDAPYTFTWENILEFLEVQKIKKEEVIEIHRSNISGKHQWYIIFKPKELLNTDNQKVIQLDGKTGEILKTEIIDAARHLD